MNNKNLKSRKNDNGKKIDIKKIDVKNPTSKVASTKVDENTKRITKMSSSKGIVSTKEDKVKASATESDKAPKVKKEKVKTGFWFRKLSRVGQLMLIIYIALACVFGFFLFRSLMNRGNIIWGERAQPVSVITNEQVQQVQAALTEQIPADHIYVEVRGARFVVIMDLPDDISARNATNANNKAIDIINGILPLDTYFSSTGDQPLNNDLVIYSADMIPQDYETNSRFIIETYKNSRMSAPSSHNLLDFRDEASRDQVLESMRAAQEAANAGE